MRKQRPFGTVQAALVFFTIQAASADLYRFTFSPNDLIGLYTSGGPTLYRPEQADARLVYQRTPLDFSKAASTFTDHPSRGSRWEGDENYYTDWLAGLGEGEGIRAFNIWITPADYLSSFGNPYTREDILQQMYSLSGDISGWSATSVGDWTAEVCLIYSHPTEGPSYGIQWSTDNPDAYLRPGGTDLGSFSFTLADVAVNANGDSPEGGQGYRFWFGSTSLVFDDQGWGRGSIGEIFSSVESNDTGWEAGVVLIAEAVPEPTVVFLLVFSGTGLIAVRRFMRCME